jgi:hypothetical protein
MNRRVLVFIKAGTLLFFFLTCASLIPTIAVAGIIFESGTLGPTGIFIEEIDGEGDAPGDRLLALAA